MSAQQNSTSPAEPAVTFRFDWSQGIPWQKYSVTVQEDGKTNFQGEPAPEAAGGGTDLFQQDFVMSEANRGKIFDAAARLKYFQGDFDSHLKKIAQTGAKSLEYTSPTTHGVTTYNWSPNSDMQELTRLFMAIANTIDYGRKLAFQYRFDKLGLNTRLKELQEMKANHTAEEVNILEPILRKIADDPDMMHISRQAAQQLLRTSGALATQ